MKILLISNLFPTPQDPNRGIFTKQLVQEMKKVSDVTVVCPLPWFPKWSILQPLKKWYPFALIPDRYEIDGVEVFSPKYLIVPNVSEAIHSLFMYWGMRRTVEKLHRERHFEAINAQWLYPDGVASSWIAKKLGLALVLTGLGCDVNLDFLNSSKRRQILASIRQSSAVTVVSDGLRQRIQQDAGPVEIDVIPNGVNTEVFKPMDRDACGKELGLSSDEKRIVFVGRLLDLKGINELIGAFDLLSKERSDAKLYLVGDGPQREEYERKVQALGLSGRVRFVGAELHSRVVTWLGAADVFCLPSHREGMPNVVLEALSCGRPAVATRVGGIPEIVNSENGVLVEPQSADSLHEGLKMALFKKWDPDAIHGSVQAFSWGRAAKHYVSVIEGAAQKYKRGAGSHEKAS